jgi:hypothetical protein
MTVFFGGRVIAPYLNGELSGRFNQSALRSTLSTLDIGCDLIGSVVGLVLLIKTLQFYVKYSRLDSAAKKTERS